MCDKVSSISILISIHALRVEGDILLHYYTREIAYISIHALRVEGDMTLPIRFTSAENFYPRPPGGGRQINCVLIVLID